MREFEKQRLPRITRSTTASKSLPGESCPEDGVMEDGVMDGLMDGCEMDDWESKIGVFIRLTSLYPLSDLRWLGIENGCFH